MTSGRNSYETITLPTFHTLPSDRNSGREAIVILARLVRTQPLSFGAVRKPGLGLFLGIVTGLLATVGIAYGQSVEENAAALADIILAVDTLWFVVAGILVFFMQAGFGLLEAGFVRVKNTSNILMKNVLDASAGAVVWWAVGFGFAFGGSQGGLVGGDSFFPALGGLTDTSGGVSEAAVFFFQWAFAATAATIVSGALAERTKFSAYLFYTVFVTGIIYPIVIHWGWGGGWLGERGFMDYAGSTLVHSVGAWAGLMGAIMVGPRIGKYVGSEIRAIPGHNMTLATLGMFILWFGWYGFNAGSTLGLSGGLATEAAWIAINTTLAAGTGAIVAMSVAKFRYGKADLGLTVNGALAGLVSITAGCGFVEPWAAILIGGIGGGLVVFAVETFDRIKIDDPVGAISVHGVCGVWGTLAVGLFATAGAAEAWGAPGHGLFMGGGFRALLEQLIGVLSIFAWVTVTSAILFLVIKKTIGLRVSENEELAGLDVQEHGIGAYPEFPTVAPGVAVEISAGEESPAPAGSPAGGGGGGDKQNR